MNGAPTTLPPVRCRSCGMQDRESGIEAASGSPISPSTSTRAGGFSARFGLLDPTPRWSEHAANTPAESYDGVDAPDGIDVPEWRH
ncbi:hypothetical protein ACU4GR_24050 [Methylobacterium oryzae CBMB20]